LKIIFPLISDRISVFDARVQSRHNRLVDAVNAGGGASGMDVEFGFDFSAFGNGDVGVVQ
jgi:hypothetical protein